MGRCRVIRVPLPRFRKAIDGRASQRADAACQCGVRGGSPGEKGGLQGGDVIVEFGGQKITNIYDYTYALDAVKIGKALKVIVERGGKKVELTVTPEARK